MILLLKGHGNMRVYANNEQPTVDEYKQRIEQSNDMLWYYQLSDWQFKVTKQLNIHHIGMTVYKQKVIYMNYYCLYLLSWDFIKHTQLHEIAHALTPNKGHGIEWQLQCRQIGISHRRVLQANFTLVKDDIYKIEFEHPPLEPLSVHIEHPMFKDWQDDFPDLPW